MESPDPQHLVIKVCSAYYTENGTPSVGYSGCREIPLIPQDFKAHKVSGFIIPIKLLV